jgi:small subunit ribosomal protein S18
VPRNSKGDKKQRRSTPRPTAGGRVRRGRPKVCILCSQHTTWVDYKDVSVLRRFMSDRGKIKSRGTTGTCAQHQRDVAVAVKTARELALLPYAVRTVASDPSDRRGRRPRPAGPTPDNAESADEATPASDPTGSAPDGADDQAEPAAQDDDIVQDATGPPAI